MATTGCERGGFSQKGQALLEMALVTPLLVALALGVIEMGRYAYIALLVGNAAHAGAAYGAQSVVTATDSTGIKTAADNDFRGNGQRTNKLDVQGGFSGSYAACTCDSQGSENPDPPQPSYCNPPPVGTNNSAGSCPAGHWVVVVSVEASGKFNSLFNYPAIPSSITVDRTATIRVAQ